MDRRLSAPTVTPFVVRTWRLYRFRGVGELLYIGQTAQVALARLQQHLESRWWALLATGWEVDPRVFYSEAEVRWAEECAIKAERPRCNVVHNQSNPNRWRSMADVPLAQRPCTVVASSPTVAPRRAPAVRTGVRWWTWHRAGIVAVVAIWGTGFGVLASTMHNAGAAGVLTGLVFVPTWRRSGRRRRRRR